MHTMPVRRPHRAIVLAICRRHCCRRRCDTVALAICVASSSSSPDWCGHAVIVVVSHQPSSLSSPVVVTPWYWPHPRHVVVGSPSFSPAVAVVVTVSSPRLVSGGGGGDSGRLRPRPRPRPRPPRRCHACVWQWQVVGGGGGGDGGWVSSSSSSRWWWWWRRRPSSSASCLCHSFLESGRGQIEAVKVNEAQEYHDLPA